MWGKSFAAGLLSFPLTIAIVGLIILLWPGDIRVHTLPLLLMVLPAWVAAMVLPFLFKRAWHAWAWMGAVTIIGFGLIHLIKAFKWVEITV
ncbi:hypothetical protein [Chitinimonas naiadis]